MSEQERSKIAGMTTPTPDGTVDEEDRAQLAGVKLSDQGEAPPPGEGTSSWKLSPSGFTKFPFF